MQTYKPGTIDEETAAAGSRPENDYRPLPANWTLAMLTAGSRYLRKGLR